MNIKDAEAQLAAAEKAGWTCAIDAEADVICEECRDKSEAGTMINKATFGTRRVAIRLAKALSISHHANPAHAVDGADKNAHHDDCKGCQALAEWEKL